MSFIRNSDRKKHESGLSLLQGLGILALIGIIGAAVARYFAG